MTVSKPSGQEHGCIDQDDQNHWLPSSIMPLKVMKRHAS
jgi:hypothetical protein